jgi:hypothetical protein
MFTASPFHLQIIAGNKGYLRLSDQNSFAKRQQNIKNQLEFVFKQAF